MHVGKNTYKDATKETMIPSQLADPLPAKQDDILSPTNESRLRQFQKTHGQTG